MRHVQIGARIVGYDLRQAARRRLAMSIDERGLRVGAPMGLSLGAIEDFIRSHGAWVLDKLDDFGSRRVRRQISIRHGVHLPLLDGEVEVRIGSGGNRFRWHADHLELSARPGADLDALARRALQSKAMDVFSLRLDHFAPLMGHRAPALSLSSARTRWGSCSRETGIRLNWRLIHLPLELVDYVVIHELSHLRQMNHSARFWAEVASQCPDWRTRRERLKHRGAEIPII
ncbi:MAG: M48 family metallopeptidase [Proteobacteria bacterium]|nr:M48 family metallopeptidase [Pseudomonadota bacterium]HQR04972.1 SprT family zinc-dependent metalloprotease [Rhodocyclaceae bacterium]